jgi:hypothetical protein
MFAIGALVLLVGGLIVGLQLGSRNRMPLVGPSVACLLAFSTGIAHVLARWVLRVDPLRDAGYIPFALAMGFSSRFSRDRPSSRQPHCARWLRGPSGLGFCRTSSVKVGAGCSIRSRPSLPDDRRIVDFWSGCGLTQAHWLLRPSGPEATCRRVHRGVVRALGQRRAIPARGGSPAPQLTRRASRSHR